MLYFAYGSNLCVARLRDRVPGARFVGLATLEGYVLRWHKRSNKDESGKLSVAVSGESNAAVPGALFAIPVGEKRQLDRAEGLGYGYEQRTVVTTTTTGPIEAVTYVASPSHIDDELVPFSWYRDIAAAGAASLGLPDAHVHSMRNAPAKQDPDPDREAKERAFLPCEGADARAYLQAEFITMTILGSLGRSSTYRKGATEAEKKEFRKSLGVFLLEQAPRYVTPVDEGEHLRIVTDMCSTLSAGHGDALRNGRFRVGVAQKALNLFLKYLWCAGWCAEPPHCPFDSIVIARLPKAAQLAWTKLDDIEEYVALVAAARQAALGRSLAVWELMEYSAARPGAV